MNTLLQNTIVFFVGFIATFIADFKLSMEVYKLDFQKFRQYEQNKELVWYVEQYHPTKNKKILFAFITNKWIGNLLGLLVAGTITLIFGRTFLIGVLILSSTLFVIHLFGAVANIFAYRKIKKILEKENEARKNNTEIKP